MTLHEILHFLVDAVNVTEHVRGDVHAAIDAHAGQVATVAADAAVIATDVAAVAKAAESTQP